jgi:hypothetical protein
MQWLDDFLTQHVSHTGFFLLCVYVVLRRIHKAAPVIGETAKEAATKKALGLISKYLK